MSKITLSPPNAILFVFDPTNKNVVIPSYVDSALTAATDTCVSVGTQADVDGNTEVSLEISDIVPADLERVFAGFIAVPGGKIAVVTSQLQRILETDVPVGAVGVTIWTDDLRSPAHVAVSVKPTTDNQLQKPAQSG